MPGQADQERLTSWLDEAEHGVLHYYPWDAGTGCPQDLSSFVSCELAEITWGTQTHPSLMFRARGDQGDPGAAPGSFLDRLRETTSVLTLVLQALEAGLKPLDRDSLALTALRDGDEQELVPRFLVEGGNIALCRPTGPRSPAGETWLGRTSSPIRRAVAKFTSRTRAAWRFAWCGVVRPEDRQAADRLEMVLESLNRQIHAMEIHDDPEVLRSIRLLPRACVAVHRGTTPEHLRFGLLGVPLEAFPLRWLLKGEYQYLLSIERRIGRLPIP